MYLNERFPMVSGLENNGPRAQFQTALHFQRIALVELAVVLIVSPPTSGGREPVHTDVLKEVLPVFQ